MNFVLLLLRYQTQSAENASTLNAGGKEVLMRKRIWGIADGKEISLITISSGTLKAEIANYGGVLKSLWVLGKNGEPVDVVLGFDALEKYIDQECYLGTTVGRCANRIKDSRFVLNGKEYHVDRNEGNNHLHGGRKGFWNVVWEIADFGDDYVVLTYHSPDGECGYPGNLDCTLEYRMEKDKLRIRYTAVSDQDTVFNPTNHSYFNLNGHSAGTIEDHVVRINADQFTELNSESISSGNILKVENTPFDLRSAVRIGTRLADNHEQMRIGKGFDLNFVLNTENDITVPAADLFSEVSGIGMEVFTDREGMHFYTGNHLSGSLSGKGGAVYPRFGALCFETQHFPNAINIENFPSPVLKKGETRTTETIFRFYTKA
jgi:aldose 1-epimerase